MLTRNLGYHYDDVIMGAMASQITSLTIVYSTVYSGEDKRKHEAPRHWPLCGEFTGDRWIPRTNGQWRGKCFHFPFDDVIMIESRIVLISFHVHCKLSKIPLESDDKNWITYFLLTDVPRIEGTTSAQIKSKYIFMHSKAIGRPVMCVQYHGEWSLLSKERLKSRKVCKYYCQ